MPAKKSHSSQPTSTEAAKKPTVIAQSPQKSPETSPESIQEVVESPASVEAVTPVAPPASELKPTKLPPPIKRASSPLPDFTQESVGTPTQTSAVPDSSSAENDAFFQAVGIIVGDVRFDENGRGSIAIDQKQYPLFYAPNHKRSYEALKKEIERTADSRQRLLVYPRVTHFPKREQNHRIGFQLVGFEGAGRSLQKDMGLSDWEFKLCGLWQFIPVCSIPCLSIFKNFTQERLAHIKDRTPEQKVRFMKASHIPVLWRDAPTRPFRFNPKLDKEQQGQASFVGIVATFLPERDVFGFSRLYLQPTNEWPKFLKAGKKDKAQALQNRRQRG